MGFAALALCPSYATVAPTGGNRPLLGTNPLAFGWPRPGRTPYVFDFATSVAARGEIELHRRAGRPLPEGWAIDADGRPTTSPAAALSGAMLPFGGHKGSAIGTMIELLAGIMIGDLTSAEALEQLGSTALSPAHGELLLAFSPEAFAAGRPGAPFDRAERLFEAIAGLGARDECILRRVLCAVGWRCILICGEICPAHLTIMPGIGILVPLNWYAIVSALCDGQRCGGRRCTQVDLSQVCRPKWRNWQTRTTQTRVG